MWYQVAAQARNSKRLHHKNAMTMATKCCDETDGALESSIFTETDGALEGSVTTSGNSTSGNKVLITGNSTSSIAGNRQR